MAYNRMREVSVPTKVTELRKMVEGPGMPEIWAMGGCIFD